MVHEFPLERERAALPVMNSARFGTRIATAAASKISSVERAAILPNCRHRRCACRVLQHGLEHGLQIERRAADDLEHVGGRGLLLQRSVIGALAQFVEQPRVLDGDDGLGGEVLQQLDLLVGERPHLLAVDAEHADKLAILEHRNVDQRAGAAALRDDDGRLLAGEIGFVEPQIGNLQSPLVAATRASGLFGAGENSGSRRRASANSGGALCSATARNALPSYSVIDAEFRIADTRGVFEHGRKDRLQLAGRRTDDAQDIRRRRLLLQRLPQFIEQPRVLDGDDRLRGKIPHQCDLLVGKRLHLLPIDVDGADQHIVLEHWHGEQCADAGQFDAGDGEGSRRRYVCSALRSATWTTSFDDTRRPGALSAGGRNGPAVLALE